MHEEAEFGSGPFPRAMLIAAALLIGVTLLSVSLARTLQIKSGETPSAKVVQQHQLRFADRPGGGVLVTDARSGRVIREFEPGSNGFLRGVMRGLARERKRDQLGEETPFVLTHWSDGRLSIEDPANGHRIELEAFGRTNMQVFADLLASAEQAR
jgi:putative photosynthetic complex assembly protein